MKEKHFIIDSTDGLKINEVRTEVGLSRKGYRVSMFDDDHVAIELENGFRPVSIMLKVRKINRERSRKLNMYRSFLNGGK
jgi:hypothetical protein